MEGAAATAGSGLPTLAGFEGLSAETTSLFRPKLAIAELTTVLNGTGKLRTRSTPAVKTALAERLAQEGMAKAA